MRDGRFPSYNPREDPDEELHHFRRLDFWKLLLSGFGMSSTVPYRVVSTAIFMLGNWFLFVWIRRRLGGWAALIATLPILFLGAAYEDLLWFSSVTFLGALTCGLGMLVALDRGDCLGDALACACLVGAMLCQSLWIAFAAGAALDIALRRHDRDWRPRLYLPIVPLAIYALWWLGWGHEADSGASLDNLASTPLFVFDSVAAAMASLLGLAVPNEGTAKPGAFDVWRALAVLLLGLGLWRAHRLKPLPHSFWVVLAIALAFWLLGGLAVTEGRAAWSSRYQLPGAVFVLLVAAELMRGVKLDRRAVRVAAAIALAAVVGNTICLYRAYDSYLGTTEIIRADLAALEIARESVDPGLRLTESISETSFVGVAAGPYLDAADELGSPAYTTEELQAAPARPRLAADQVLLNALGLALEPARPPAETPARAAPASGEPVAVPRDGCVTVPRGSDPAPLVLPPGGAVVAATSEPLSGIALTRFAPASEPGVAFPAAIAPGEAMAVRIPADLSGTPWKLWVSGGEATVCGLGHQADPP